jgi:quercetin dioxygenase-like cupin family protein
MELPAGAERKPWGWTMALGSRAEGHHEDGFRILIRDARIHVKEGGYSSIHLHHSQSNTFHVLEGQLLVSEYELEGDRPVLVGSHTLHPGDALTFKANVPHRFLALTEVEALEVYVATPDGDAFSGDIQRFTENGCDPAMAHLHA